MRNHENMEEELQRNIEEQEQALTALLERIMDSPLAALRKKLDELREWLGKVENDNKENVQGVQIAMGDAAEAQEKFIDDNKKDIDGLRNGLTGLAATLSQHNNGQIQRDERVNSSLARTQELLSTLDAKADTADAALAATKHDVAMVDDALRALQKQEQASADRLNHVLSDIEGQLKRQQTDLNTDLLKIQALLAQLNTKMVGILNEAKKLSEDLRTALPQPRLLQKWAVWLIALSGLSLASSLTAVGVLLLRR